MSNIDMYIRHVYASLDIRHAWRGGYGVATLVDSLK